MSARMRVLVAGIGGASLGTEILKALRLAGGYELFGCDISPLAFGHYDGSCRRTLLVRRESYVEDVLSLCHELEIQAVIPGGEEPLSLLQDVVVELNREGIRLACNSAPITSCFSDKAETFRALQEKGFPVPLTRTASSARELPEMCYPCVVKPSTGSGGSSLVYLAEDRDAAAVYVDYLLRNRKTPILQEYLPLGEGEFTIGVLSLPDGRLAGSIALRRVLDAKLSVLYRGPSGVISSGYSQGLIENFPEQRDSAEKIAAAFGSVGPLNIQGRMKNGLLVPFEINPRFSASTYLRALAGFNEIDWFLQSALLGRTPEPEPIRYGYYLRSLTETYVPHSGLRQ
jgi:carbamoyl-phosphate synthase large subunit